MTRVRVVLAAAVAILVVVVLATSSSGSDGSDGGKYRFSAVFDTAQGIVPGQLVKIAGARVGTVSDLKLTPDNQARFSLSIDGRFGPFHDDATCKILPEGFISESFIQCDPGTPGRPDLGAVRDSGTSQPTVPVSRTSASVQLQQVIDTFSMPVSSRISSIFSELGISIAGRPQDLDALLRRANPALGQTKKMLAILARQRAVIGDAVGQTDGVLRVLSQRDRALRSFVSRAANVTETTAAHQRNLQAGVRSLPALLRQTKTSLASLETVSDKLTPTVRALRRTAPSISKLEDIAPRFTATTRPALKRLDPGLRSLRSALPSTTPLLGRLKTTAATTKQPMTELQQLLESLRKTGGNEDLIDFFYGLAVGLSPFDSVSHSVSIQVAIDARCIVKNDAPGCSGQFRAPGKGQIPVNDPQFASPARKAERIIGDPKKAAAAVSPSDAAGLKILLDKLLK